MSDKNEKHSEWTGDERFGAVQYMAILATLHLVSNPSFKGYCQALKQHLREDHGFEEKASEAEVMNIAAEGLNLIIESIQSKGGVGVDHVLSSRKGN